MALAYFITFTTYGTWLPGSAKGKGSVDKAHNAYGMPFVAPDAERQAAAQRAMTQPAYFMSAAERDIVCQAIVDLARDRQWHLLAVHVRTNHVHVVLAADRDPGRIMAEMKARASRDLTRAGHGSAERRRWTRHGSTQHLFRETDVEGKVRYTLDGQGERMAHYPREPRTK
jgi:REP element-mobilizing transposase RayT